MNSKVSLKSLFLHGQFNKIIKHYTPAYDFDNYKSSRNMATNEMRNKKEQIDKLNNKYNMKLLVLSVV